MDESGLTRLKIRLGESEIDLERKPSPTISEATSAHMMGFFPSHPSDMGALPSAMPAGGMEPAPSAPPPAREETAHFVTSPMVGTFYRSPSPEAEPFVQVGDRIEEDSVVCIVEAMKVMNEVKAQITGIVTEVLVDSGRPVEYGTQLFKVTPQ